MIGLARGSVRLAPYNPKWTLVFAREREVIRSQISDHVVAIEHVGSTAIPGMLAKPIIDIAAAIPRLGDVKKCVHPLEKANYEYRGIVKPGDRLFVKGDPSSRLFTSTSPSMEAGYGRSISCSETTYAGTEMLPRNMLP